jgi:hypothetical protein
MPFKKNKNMLRNYLKIAFRNLIRNRVYQHCWFGYGYFGLFIHYRIHQP